jgi:hypothetical protein
LVIESDHRSPLPLGMRTVAKICVLVIASSLLTSTSAHALAKQGAPCKKSGITSTVNGFKFTCIKSGKKLVWSKGVPLKKPAPKPSIAPTPTPVATPEASPTPVVTPAPTATPEPIVLPTSFDDLFVNRKGISLAAWQKSSEIIKASKSKAGTLEIFTGPNTTPNFDDYPTPVSLVSRLFPARSEPARTIVIRYKYVDIAWAEETLRSKLTVQEFNEINNREGGRAIAGRCDTNSKDCVGAMQQTTPSGLSLIIQAVPNGENRNDPTSKFLRTTGMLEAHEYFHALQRIVIMGKTQIWPHAWFREGSAHWVQNIAVNYAEFKKYQEFSNLSCQFNCKTLSEGDITEFLVTSNDNYTAPKFDQFLNYNLSSRFIEALVALKGPDTLIELYEQMGKRLTFDQAFKNTYGVEWGYALPILAKTIYANLQEGN